MKCFAILLQAEFYVGGKKLFHLDKATEKYENGKRIKVYAKFDEEHEKDRQKVEVRKKIENRETRADQHMLQM